MALLNLSTQGKTKYSKINDILTFFNYIYQKFELKNEEIKEHPILITQPILNPYANRKQIPSVILDKLSSPAIFFSSQPIYTYIPLETDRK